MSEYEMLPEAARPHDTGYGNYGPVRVYMADTIGSVALAIVSVLLLRALLKERAHNRALIEKLLGDGN